jgi:saccharopine dehydrogenase-like NADP-dependent oxidoreductase
MKKILILGAGLVSRPHVRYLLDVQDFEVTVASRTVSKAETLIKGHPRGHALALDVDTEAALEALIQENDLAVSLLPYAYHPVVARLCVKHRRHMVTTSYVKDAMRALDDDARAAGVILLNEIGVDPGIDHMSALRVIHDVERRGGRVTSFDSWCGGLPAPEASDNPIGYKFSWSPKGVLLAGKNPARFLRDGQLVEVPGEELFDNFWTVQIQGLGDFECYPNRDSLPYMETYGITPSGWMFRGTLRNVGWCATLRKVASMGYLDDTPLASRPATFGQLTAQLLGVSPQANLVQYLSGHWGLPQDAKPITDLAWLGLLSDEPLPAGKNTPIDVLTARMEAKMAYQPGERDMLIMQHEFVAEFAEHKEAITSTMIDFGVPYGDTSMSRTVGLPAAIAVRMILHGEIRLAGVHTPVIPAIYEPVLAELEELGIGLHEKVEIVQ